MSALFEDFLRSFFQLHRKEYRVRAESQQWSVTGATEHDLAFLPRMVTDITLRHPDQTIIIDAKFYGKGALMDGLYGERLHSDHLYQLVTYLQHERVRQPEKGLAGMLLYAAVNRSVRLKYQLLGIPILVATVDLAKDWRDIETELHNLLDRCNTAARAPGEGSVTRI
jgi:5-methylcytosine-specific restriction enzyme subunit McrC